MIGIFLVLAILGSLGARIGFPYFANEPAIGNKLALTMLLAGIVVVIIARLARSGGDRPQIRKQVAEQPPAFAEHPAGSNSTQASLPESLTRRKWRQHSTMAHYEPGTLRDRTASLLESLLTSAAVVAVVSLVMGILRGAAFVPNQYAWLAATSLLGAWSVLVPAKLWEGKKIDGAVRRFVFLVIGLAIGAVSYGILQWLLVALPPDPKLGISDSIQGLQSEFFNSDGSPRMSALAAYYGFVFVMMRWWKLADPLRHTRLSLWSVAVAVFWSYAVNLFWPFPQPWGMMTVATIAVAVQMASPCVKSRSSAAKHSYD